MRVWSLGGEDPLEKEMAPVFLPENSMDSGAWWATVHGLQRVRHDWVAEHAWTLGYVSFWIMFFSSTCIFKCWAAVALAPQRRVCLQPATCVTLNKILERFGTSVLSSIKWAWWWLTSYSYEDYIRWCMKSALVNTEGIHWEHSMNGMY